MTHEGTSQSTALPVTAETNEAVFPPTLEGNLAFWEERVNRLAIEAPTIAGVNQYPEWYFKDNDRLGEIIPQLKAEGADLSNASKYYELFAKENAIKSSIAGSAPYAHPVQLAAQRLGEDLLGRALAAEPVDGAIHTAMIDDLSQSLEQTTGALGPELNVLKEAYGVESVTALLGIGGDEYSNKLRSLLLHEKSIRWIRFADQDRKDDFKWADHQEASRAWMSKAVEAAAGMSSDEASDYVFSASRHANDTDVSIIEIVKKFDHFGVNRIREIAKATGIHGLEAYSIEQLERMEEFAQDPAKVAEHLEGHDVIAVMVNRVGDHNGVMHNVAADFDDDHKRALFFEINTMDDIYRRMIKLNKAGIKPSTLVLAAHSAPGEFMVSDVREKAAIRRDIAAVAGRKLVAMVNSADDPNFPAGDFFYSMHGMKGLSRLVDTYMRPSRSIDDNDADNGREKIIFQACYAASEVIARDLDEHDEKADIGVDSVISQLGRDLIAMGTKSKIDIYGAAEGIQLQKNGRGVHYTGQPNASTFGQEGRPHLAAQRVRIQGGALTQQEVYDIPLRNSA